MSFNFPIRRFFMPEDPADGNGPIINPTPYPTPTPPPGGGYYDCGSGCIYYNYDPLCPSCTPAPTPTPTPPPTDTPLPTPTPTPTPECIDFNLPDQMLESMQSFLVDRVGYYKINLSQTQKNIYGEALEKWFYEGVTVRGSIERSPENIGDEMFGPDVNQAIKVTIPQAALDPSNNLGLIVPANVKPEIGDILLDIDRERYYEVHNVTIEYYPIITNAGNMNCPQTKILNYVLECYHTRVSRLNLTPYKLL